MHFAHKNAKKKKKKKERERDMLLSGLSGKTCGSWENQVKPNLMSH